MSFLKRVSGSALAVLTSLSLRLAGIVDLLAPKKITGIITQGAKDFGNIQYVESFKVAYSDDGATWIIYKDKRTKADKLFLANSDNYSHKKNMFDPPFSARYVRVLPYSWHERITLRMELLGCVE